MTTRRSAVALGAAGLLSLLALSALPAAAAAVSRPQVRILGFTTNAPLGVPPVQGKPGTTVTECGLRGGGMRDLYVIYSGTGIAKGTKVGAALWGPPRNPAGVEVEPSVADTMRTAYRWPVRAEQTKRQVWGYGFAQGPFGPVSIDGRWTASVVVAGRTLVRKSITIACAN
ncbi:MAG TPA: hypothetical protein VLK58_12255 [Conexibacter sp.]|nr:hypothetical protein [Conexibacter sp.]